MKKVMLVDDTQTVLMLEKIILGTGYQYIDCRNALEAYDQAKLQKPDIILMDINMPVLDGIGGLKLLKGDPSTKDIPVVMVTTRGEPANLELCMQLGASEFVVKPFDRVGLQNTVKKFLEKTP